MYKYLYKYTNTINFQLNFLSKTLKFVQTFYNEGNKVQYKLNMPK